MVSATERASTTASKSLAEGWRTFKGAPAPGHVPPLCLPHGTRPCVDPGWRERRRSSRGGGLISGITVSVRGGRCVRLAMVQHTLGNWINGHGHPQNSSRLSGHDRITNQDAKQAALRKPAGRPTKGGVSLIALTLHSAEALRSRARLRADRQQHPAES